MARPRHLHRRAPEPNGCFRDYAYIEREVRTRHGGLLQSEFWWLTERMLETLAAGRP